MKKLNRKQLKQLINESVINILNEAASSDEIRTQEEKLANYRRYADEELEKFRGNAQDAYAHGYLQMLEDGIREIEQKIADLKAELPATQQMELPFEEPAPSAAEKRRQDVASMEDMEKHFGYDPSRGYLSDDAFRY